MLKSLSIPLFAKGYHVLRYNSRGVGRTTGWASFTGIQESEDLRGKRILIQVRRVLHWHLSLLLYPKELIDWALTKLSNVQHILIIVRCMLLYNHVCNNEPLSLYYRDILMGVWFVQDTCPIRLLRPPTSCYLILLAPDPFSLFSDQNPTKVPFRLWSVTLLQMF